MKRPHLLVLIYDTSTAVYLSQPVDWQEQRKRQALHVVHGTCLHPSLLRHARLTHIGAPNRECCFACVSSVLSVLAPRFRHTNVPRSQSVVLDLVWCRPCDAPPLFPLTTLTLPKWSLWASNKYIGPALGAIFDFVMTGYFCEYYGAMPALTFLGPPWSFLVVLQGWKVLFISGFTVGGIAAGIAYPGVSTYCTVVRVSSHGLTGPIRVRRPVRDSNS